MKWAKEGDVKNNESREKKGTRDKEKRNEEGREKRKEKGRETGEKLNIKENMIIKVIQQL